LVLVNEPQRIVPVPDELTEGFWTAAASGVLAVQRCVDCGHRQHPPERLCVSCGGTRLPYQPVSGDATLFSWTVTRHNLVPMYEPELPYVAVVVELVEQPNLFCVSDLFGRDVDVSALHAGMPMRVTFDARAGDVTLPRFVPAGAA
jgi:uncharacterized OB-fold protein